MIHKSRTSEGGFTIMELIIVLTVSVAITASALAIFNGRISRTRFETSVNDLASRLESAMSDISSGYYPNTGVDCSISGGAPTVVTGSTEQGENSDCIFIGNLVKFGRGTSSQGNTCSSGSENCDVVRFYTLIGSRVDSAGDLSGDINAANPIVSENLFQDYVIPYGTYITKVGIGGNNDSAVGLAKSFGTSLSVGGDLEGSSTTELLTVRNGTGLGKDELLFVSDFNDLRLSPQKTFESRNPTDGVLICLGSASSNQFAAIEFGKNGATGAVERFIQEGSPAPGC